MINLSLSHIIIAAVSMVVAATQNDVFELYQKDLHDVPSIHLADIVLCLVCVIPVLPFVMPHLLPQSSILLLYEAAIALCGLLHELRV